MTLVRFTVSFLYSLAGISACVAFILLKNYPAAILAIATGILNTVLSHVHFQNYRNQLQEWYTPSQLRQMGHLGFCSFALGTSAFIYFLVIEIMTHQPILPIEYSVVVSMIWSFITLKSGIILWCYARFYSREEHTLLVEEAVQEDEEEDEDHTELIEP